jgi:putative ABC transport system substrate-binding protein
MDRRRFLLTSLLGALAAWRASGAQAATVARIGYLANSSTFPNLIEAFFQGLRDLGYVDGGNIVVEYRSAEGKSDRLPALAAELVALKVDVIVTRGGTFVALTAKQATRTVPIVFIAAGDPVTSGLVTALRGQAATLRGCPFYFQSSSANVWSTSSS